MCDNVLGIYCTDQASTGVPVMQNQFLTQYDNKKTKDGQNHGENTWNPKRSLTQLPTRSIKHSVNGVSYNELIKTLQKVFWEPKTELGILYTNSIFRKISDFL